MAEAMLEKTSNDILIEMSDNIAKKSQKIC